MKAWPFLAFVVSILLLANIHTAFAQVQATITIMDYEGVNPLFDAKLVIADSASPEDKREFTADENGVVTIMGIDPGAEYLVEVYWNNPEYGDEEILVFQREIQGGVLQAMSEIRVHVFNVEIIPLDKGGKPLLTPLDIALKEPAVTYLDGVKQVVEEEVFTARYILIPQGRHRLRIDWLGYTVYEEEVEIGLETLEGYIPGVDDPSQYNETVQRTRKLWVETSVADMEITVTDPDGNPVSAPVTIIDPEGLYQVEGEELSGIGLWVDYREGGRVDWSQLPIVEYRVLVLSPFDLTEVLAENTCVPAQPCKIMLDPNKGPYYTFKVRVVTEYGTPIEGALVELSGWGEPTDANGTVVFTCVRPGTYTLRALLGENEVYPAETIEVRESTEIEITIGIESFKVNITLVTGDFRPYEVYWSLDSYEGAHYDSGEKPSSRIVIQNISLGNYELKIVVPEYGLEYKFGPFAAETLVIMNMFTLPIADTRIVLSTPEGGPAANYLVRLCIKEVNICFENRTDENGEALFVNLPHEVPYNLTIFSDGTPLGTYDLTMTSPIIPLEIPSKSAPPPAVITKTVTQTLTTTKEVTITPSITRTVTPTPVGKQVKTVTKTITETITETETAEGGGSPIIQIVLGIAIVAVFLVVTIALTREKKTSK